MRPAVAREITGFGGIYNHAETIRAEGAGSAKKYPFKAFSWALRLKQTHSHYNGSPRPKGARRKTMFNPNAECRVEGHKFRWTIIEDLCVSGVHYALLESSVGDESPYIVAILDNSMIEMRTYTNSRTGESCRLPTILEGAVVADDVYDDLETALKDCEIL
jgi:hypothetical protein